MEKGIIFQQWAGFIISAMVIFATIITGYVTMKTKVKENAVDIKEIKEDVKCIDDLKGDMREIKVHVEWLVKDVKQRNGLG